MDFQYQPLKSDEIRLLQPISRSSGPLRYRIVHVSLTSKPHYAALSYTWGSPGYTHHVSLNGQRFPIRQNLYDALDQISSTKLVNRYLWVDAICVNQGENVEALDERSTQITLMRQIYEQAGKVLVWLGKPDDDINNRLAFQLLKTFEARYYRIVRRGHSYRPRWWQTKERTFADDTADFRLSLSPSNDREVFDVPGSQTHKGWLGIASLWEKPWWARTWVYQEATIPERWKWVAIYGVVVYRPKYKVKFLCGDQQTDWSQLYGAGLVAESILKTSEVDSQFLKGVNGTFWAILRLRFKRIQLISQPFLEILQSFRQTECFDLRDKVYAPLCLASEDVRYSISPDYANKTVLDVYADVARYCLSQPGHSLDFLGYTMYQEQEQSAETSQGTRSTLPSWMPNFSDSLNLVPIPKVLFVPAQPRRKGMTLIDRSGLPTNNELQIPAYGPLGDMTSTSFIEGATLFVRGAYIDILKEKMADTGPDMELVKANAIKTGVRWAAALNYQYFTGESFISACNRSILLDVAYDSQGRPSIRGNAYDRALVLKPQAELTPTEYTHQTTMQIAQHNACSSRDLGLSQKHYILAIPNTAVAGDTIWALAGGQVLYLLRPVNLKLKQYIFVGECYGHGLMDGEIVKQLHSCEIKMEDIYLI